MIQYKAAIFDMDGVIVNNHNYHVKAWASFCKNHRIPFNEQNFRTKYFGKSNRDILPNLTNSKLSQFAIDELAEEKELIYRNIYRDDIKPISGLKAFIAKLREQGIKTAVATSAPASNLNFVLDELGIRDMFDTVVDSSMVKECKPDPEIYLKASELIGIDPKDCIVFEDSISGIQSAHNAGMEVIALITTHKAEELPKTYMQVYDFTEVPENVFY
ncbi:MAG: HAD family phosphatase [Bacteroidales bacterium]|nr:HAD family phosphatase [Bacteroidales bacterium]